MRLLLVAGAAFFLGGCHYFVSQRTLSEQKRHDICERIEYKLNFGEVANQQNIQPSALERARLLREHRRYACHTLSERNSESTGSWHRGR